MSIRNADYYMNEYPKLEDRVARMEGELHRLWEFVHADDMVAIAREYREDGVMRATEYYKLHEKKRSARIALMKGL